MNLINAKDYIQDYCTSEHFFFLDSRLKDQAEGILNYWCNETGNSPDISTIEKAFKGASHIDIDIEIKKCIPDLVSEFYKFLSTTGKIPEADFWNTNVSICKNGYLNHFRDDGSIRGETHRKKYNDIGRNDFCPCGSGKKFKKCCMGLIDL